MQPRAACHNAVVFCHTCSVALAGCAGHGCCVLHGSLSVEGPLPARSCCGGRFRPCRFLWVWLARCHCAAAVASGWAMLASWRPCRGVAPSFVVLAGKTAVFALPYGPFRLAKRQVLRADASGFCKWLAARLLAAVGPVPGGRGSIGPVCLQNRGGGRLGQQALRGVAAIVKYVAVCLQVCNKISIFAIMTYNWAA